MNLDRFRIKAKDKYGYWCVGRLGRNESTKEDTYYGVVWYREDMYGIHALHTIDPETLCQCMGIKDSDGKLIYENDYLHVKGMCNGEPVECEKALVRYDEAKLTWMVQLDDHSEYLKKIVSPGLHAWECHVVGNKFDEE